MISTPKWLGAQLISTNRNAAFVTIDLSQAGWRLLSIEPGYQPVYNSCHSRNKCASSHVLIPCVLEYAPREQPRQQNICNRTDIYEACPSDDIESVIASWTAEKRPWCNLKHGKWAKSFDGFLSDIEENWATTDTDCWPTNIQLIVRKL